VKIPVIPKPPSPAAPKPAEEKKQEKPAEAKQVAPSAAKQDVPPVPVATPPAAAGLTINAPLVGTFYSTAGPGKPKFVKPGDVVEAGAKVCIVEAMKLFNEIVAPVKCKIVQILVEDGTLVEKDQPMIAIAKIR
jgi:acetyl-CoA carboxylase biotin carboxyl carrier protein